MLPPFTEFLEGISCTRDRTAVFRDYLTAVVNMMSIKSSLKEYLSSLGKYSLDDLTSFVRAFEGMLDWMELNPLKDPLGDYFQEYISQGHNGQYFTPEPICQMMAVMAACGDSGKVYDPCCGSGRLLLAGARINRNQQFIGGDISDLCCLMTLVNLCLNDLTGEVYHMDSLSMEIWRGWRIIKHPVAGCSFIVELQVDRQTE